MAHVITFRTARFDPAAEPANPINPIAGHAVLQWLREPLRTAGYESSDPDAEDWGWYLDVTGPDATYLLGASGEGAPEAHGFIDWTIQIHRHRSVTDKLLGRNVHAADDALTALVERLARAEDGFQGVEVDRAG